jgi:ubiquinone/menaquinone biosynthesis C-methylase UbiE
LSDFNFSLPLPRNEALPATIADRTRRVYDRMAAVYPASTYLFHSKAHKRALEASRIEDGMRVLEVATGSGEMFRRLVEVNGRGLTVGLDLSPKMAARTQERIRTEFPAANAHCKAVDVRHLPFKDASFDAVFCCYLLELLSTEDISVAIREIRRVLRPDGKLTIVMIGENRRIFNEAYRVCGRLVPAFWGRQVERRVPSVLQAHRLSVVDDCKVQQGFYPSRVLVARR